MEWRLLYLSMPEKPSRNWNKNDLFRQVLGQALVEEFIAVYRFEWSEYSQAVTDWERERYLEVY